MNSIAPGSAVASSSGMLASAVKGAFAAAKAAVTDDDIPTSVSSSGQPVSISKEAKIAAAAKEDRAKDAATLADELRGELDAQEKAGAKAPDLSTMSSRAVAIVALNKTGSFSNAEQNAAKTELQQGTRLDFSYALSAATTLDGFAAYGDQMKYAYDLMSGEEREARGLPPQMPIAEGVDATGRSAS